MKKEVSVKRRRRRTEPRTQEQKTAGDLLVDAFVERAAQRAFANFLRGIFREDDQRVPSR